MFPGVCVRADYLTWTKGPPPALGGGGGGAGGAARPPTPSDGDGPSSIPLSELVEVVAGIATPVLHKRGQKSKAHLYVSLVSCAGDC